LAVSDIVYTFADAMSKKKSTTVERMLFESNLRQSIENSGRFDKPLSDMERKDFEDQIALLKETIRQNQEFINRLMDQLKEQGQKTEKAEHKVETLEHRIEELLDEIRQLNKRIKDLMDRDKRHNKMSMGKKSFKKHNRVESEKSRQEEKDDYDNSDAKKQDNPDEKASSEGEPENKEGQIDKTKVTSEFLDQKRSERGKYNIMEAAEVEILETSMDGAPANMKFVGMKTIEEYSKMSYIKCTKFVVAVYEDEYGIRHEYYAPQDPEDTRRPHENTIKGTHGTPDFMSDLIVDTCQIMTPLHRELVRMAIDKFSSSKQTLINWLETCADMLGKLMPYIKADLLGKKAVLNIDETWCRVRIKFKGDGTRLGHYFKKYVWVLVNRASKVVYFLYDNDENDSRGRRPIEKFLDKAMKALQSDGYTVYKQLTKDMPECEHILCWAHVRAKFHIAKEVSKDDYASWFEDMINKLYLIESQLIIAHATPEKIRERRQQKDVTDILTSIWCEAQRLLKQKKPRYGEMMKTALNYMCNGWADLCNYRNDGHYTIDNMVAERAIRPFTVKRKGSMFFSSEKGVKNAMIFHTIIETCKQAGIMVKDYLTYVLSELNRGNKDYASLTPSKVVLK
jgi:hypothetical protein